MTAAASARHSAETSNQNASRTGLKREFRGDIQGLRAIAVGVVVLYHLWPQRLQGGFIGVDVFFVISGFLITTHLVSKPPRRVKDFGQFWANRVRRLLPASLLVILTTVIAVRLVAPATMWRDTGDQAISSATYWQNWNLGFSAVDYLAADNAPTALQHFWSLSVEEQFYFVWPFVVVVLLALGAAAKHQMRTLQIGLGVVVVAGLVFSVWYTHANPAMAYFATTTRMWELAAGGLTAVCIRNRKAGTGLLSSGVAWLGLVVIVAAAFMLDPAAPFPGWRAAVPVVATSLVLAAHAKGPGSPNALLSLKPVQFVGNTSYSIYLWHWPLIILTPIAMGSSLKWPMKLMLIAVALLLAWLTMVFVEKRFRKWINTFSLTRTFAATAVVMALVACAGWGLTRSADHLQKKTQDQLAAAEKDPDACFGASALKGDANNEKWADCGSGKPLLLDPAAAKTDKSDAYKDGCWSNQPFDERPTCTYGTGKTQVALIGNSHAGHWLPALQELAKERDWTITTFLVSRCSVNDQPQTFDQPGQSQKCIDYGNWVKKQTTSGKFDAVITSERQSVRIEGASWAETEKLSQSGYVPFLKAWHQAGVPVAVLRDTPFPGGAGVDSIPDCVAENPDHLDKCNGTPKSWHWMDPLADAVKQQGYKDQHVIQTQDWICPDGSCKSTIGRVVTYFDSSHLTATYARTLAPMVGRELDRLGIEGF